MLISISLCNWRSHANTTLSFARGANILLGPMGAGKSSVVDALCFALYGTYPKIQRRDASIEDVGNFRHAGQTVSVEAEWENAGGERYKVRREIGKKADAWLYCGGKIVQKGPKAVTAACEDAIGIGYDLFSRAVYSEQNRLDFWLAMPPSARKSELDRLLGLDAFERARANCTTEIGRKKAAAQAMESQASDAAFASSQKRAQEAGAQKEAADADSKKAEEELALRKKAAEKAIGDFALCEGKRKAYEDGKKREAQLEGRIGALASQCEEALKIDAQGEGKKAADAAARIESLGAKAGELEAEVRIARKEEGGLLAAISQAKEAKKKAEDIEKRLAAASGGKNIAQWKELLTQAKGEADGLAKKKAENNSEEKSIAASVAAIRGATGGAGCPVCGAPLDAGHREKLAVEKAARSHELAAERKLLDAQILAVSKKSVEASNAVEEIGKLQASLESLRQPPDAGAEEMLAKVREMGAKAEAEIKELREGMQNALKGQKEAEGRLAKAKDGQKAQEAMAAAKNELAQIRAKVLAAGYSEEEWAGLAEKKAAAEKEAAACGARHASNRKILEQALRLHEGALRELAALSKARGDALQARKEMDELSAFREALVATQSEVRTLLLDEINGALSHLWPILYPYSDWKMLRVKADGADYSLQVWQGEWMGLESFASGGERAAAALSLRVALSVILTPQLGWIVLDEPTHNLDARAVAVLGQMLSDHLPKIVPQAIVITHDAALVESTPGKVFRFERDKGKQEDTVVLQE